MLSWVGKRPLRHVTAFPAQHIETFAPVENVGANCVRSVVAGNADASTGADAKAGPCNAPLQETSPAQQSFTVWRSQVDCVMIDTAYNGDVFNVTLSDVPEKKNDLIEGSYTMTAPADTTTVAVKIIDILGEEVLIVDKKV